MVGKTWGLFGLGRKKGERGFLREILHETGIFGIVVLFAIILAAFQIIAYIMGFIWAPAAGIKLGMGFMMLAVAAAVMIPVTFLRIRFAGVPLTRTDIMVLILILALVIFLLLMLPKLVPDIFSVARVELARTLRVPI